MINTKLLKTISESEKVVGTKQVLKSIEGKTVKCVIVADNADGFIRNSVTALCRENGIEIISVPSKKELGRISGIADRLIRNYIRRLAKNADN